jgi:hypothetical protein
MTMPPRQRERSPRHSWTVLLLVLLLAAGTVAQAAHFHKDADDHHACVVCAVHATALAPATAISLPPPRAMVRAIQVDSAVVRYCTSTPSSFIRPPPSV